MLQERLRTSAVLIGISVTLVVLDWGASIPGVWMYPLLVFFAIGTAWEIASMLLTAGHVIRRSVAVVSAGMVSMSATIPVAWAFTESGYPADCPIGRLGWIPLTAVLVIFGILVSEMRYFDRTMLTLDKEAANEEKGKSIAGETIQRTCAALFVSMYVGLPMSMLVATRMLHAEETSGRFGLAAIITLLVVTKITDAGAFFAGRAFGRHKLIPSLSPAKTVEGAAGGVAAATIAAYLCLEFLFGWVQGDATVGKTAISEPVVKSGLSADPCLACLGGMRFGTGGRDLGDARRFSGIPVQTGRRGQRQRHAVAWPGRGLGRHRLALGGKCPRIFLLRGGRGWAIMRCLGQPNGIR